MKEQIVSIDINKIYPHPENPRKELGDLSELAKSIKKNGIMQNLTVIPIEGEAEGYTTIIGHRRHAAAKLAGITEVPCRIVDEMSDKEQMSTMLEENMQRNDLTIFEQAQGFQMMLDLGETEETIVEKTGFSKTTIRHRLNIAKLDQKELKKKEEDDSFQLTLKDLYELEKVVDIKTRNKILKEAMDSRSLVWRAQSAVKEAEKAKKIKQISEMLKKLGVEKAPKGAENEQYSGKWEIVKEIDLDKDVPKRIKLKDTDKVYYLSYYRSVRIIKRAKKEKTALTPEEAKRKQIDKNRKAIKAKLKDMAASRKDFIQNVISGKIEPLKDTAELQKLLWQVMIKGECYISMSNLALFLMDKEYFYEASEEERILAVQKIEELSLLYQMLIAMPEATKRLELIEWDGKYNEKSGETLKILYRALGLFGFTFSSDEEQELLDGTHMFFVEANEDAHS